MSGATLQGPGGLGEPPLRGCQCSRSRSACRHQIPTGLHANLSEGRPVGPARHGASSLLSPEGFFLGKMGFREAVAAGDVALPQVRRWRLQEEARVDPQGSSRGYREAI